MNLKDLPKIELHCHLDGSIRPETIISIAKKDGIEIPTENIDGIREYVMAPVDCKSLDEYLDRFTLPNKVMQTKENLKRVAYELLEDASKDNVKYIEIRFAPSLHRAKGLSFEEVIESVLEGMKEGEETYPIKSNLILSCMRTMSVKEAFKVVEAGKKYLNKGVVAIDLAASEYENFAQKYKEPIKRAREYGYRVTIHAGETGIGKNVLDAIKILKAERIGHGIYAKDSKEAYEILKNSHVIIEMCPTSNVQTKGVASYESHPLKEFFQDGIKVTLNTDNMTVSNTTLTNEHELMKKAQNINIQDYKKMYLHGVDGSFASEKIKEELRKHISIIC
ncbi:MAG: adenosine deaminase [Anaeromicrobium sp.]|jgi:adenosine deaminase|uniref:adenosine deaminase n=1 Tax=Anaeromicrobium sp. TaxID=1929132 RepID=UPI0025E01BC5|nr:adenosine deaminase [Anaeromicrobium sp.]MCT4594424.1 adenosine deaminase [Anaeromicrobium sp.]